MYSQNSEPLKIAAPRTAAPHRALMVVKEQLFFEAEDFLASLAKDIEAARISICVEMYIWSNDEVGTRFWSLLEAAARRGVNVRLVVDGVGSWFWIRAHQSSFAAGSA